MPRKNKTLTTIIRQRELFFMIIPVMAYVIIFNYVPLWGWTMAFQNYRPGYAKQLWVGLDNFKFLFQEERFFRVLRNTIAMSTINLVLGFVFAIFFALMVNEIKQKLFKRTVQTISYLPHFLSWVIACSMIADFLSSSGTLNTVLMNLGIIKQPIILLAEVNNFWWVVGWSNVWKSMGWNSIIYLAAITSIDPEL